MTATPAKYRSWKAPLKQRIFYPVLAGRRSDDRVCYLVRHHHTYANIDKPDDQILVEADFLINLLENHLTEDAQKSTYDKIFRTKSGKNLFRLLYPCMQQKTV